MKASDIMTTRFWTLKPDDTISQAVKRFRQASREQGKNVFGMMVTDEDDHLVGMLSMFDILGLVYRYCRRCRKSHARRLAEGLEKGHLADTLVEEVMTPEVMGCAVADPLTLVMEMLSTQRKSAVLVNDDDAQPAGVISKTDLVMAWYRGVDAHIPAQAIMSVPVRSCHRTMPLADAMVRMLVEDMGRLFVHDPDPACIVGVVALADAANQRSGTCRACVSSRLL